MDKRTIHLFLLMAVLLMASKASASAETITIGDFTYTFDSWGQEASVRLSSSSAAVIVPATVDIDGKTYKVTAIDNYGFTNYGYSPSGYSYWDGKDPNTYYCYRDTYANTTLQSVEFEQPCYIKRIGTGAFQGCTALESIIIPNSVEEMGTEVLTECYSLRKVEFQTDESHRVKLKVLPVNAFYLCPRLQSLELPEGIEEIGAYALQCDLSLKSIHLPNTLKKIGGHFLCNAKSLESLTIPASVKEIGGAFLHGCESLRTVYLLGGAATLKAIDDDKYQSPSFDAFPGKLDKVSTAPASKKVNNCKFYVPSDYYADYVDNEVWQQLHHDNNDLANDIITLQGHDRSFGAMKWQTVIFYKPVTSYKSVFGEGCMVAELTSATQDSSDPDFYHLTFTLIDGDDIPAHRPYLIYCPKKQTHVMYNKEDEESDDFKAFYTQRYTTDVAVSNEPSTTISMIGMGQKLALQQWDFYFKWDDTNQTGKFYRVPNANTTISKAFFGCYWQIIKNGLKQTGAMAQSKSLPSTPTGIKQAIGKQPQADLKVYDLYGRLIQQGMAGLGKGIYIVNGKKVALP